MYSYLDTPLDPYGDYTEQEKEIERQRQLAMALYKNEIATANQNGQSNLPAGGLAALLGQLGGNLGAQSTERDLYAKQQEIDRNRMAANSKFYAGIPQITPGKPEVDIPSYATGLPPWAAGTDSATGNVPVQQAMLPKAPSQGDYAQWASRAPLTPEAQKLAAETMKGLLPEPLSKQTDVTPYGIFNNVTQTWGEESPEQKARIEADQQLKRDSLQQKYDLVVQALQQKDTTDQQKLELARMALELKQQIASQAVAGKMAPSEGSSVSGNPLMRNTITGTQHEVINGVPSQEPYAGPVISKADQKNVSEVSSILNDARLANQLADQVHAHPEVFSNRANVMNTVSGLAGGLGRESMTGLTPEQLQLRGLVGRDFAATTKQLYGSSFTQSEQARGNSFVPQQGDSAGVIEQKLRGAAQFNEEMAQKYGGKILNAAQARTDAATATPSNGGFGSGIGAGMATDSPEIYNAFKKAMGGNQEPPGTPLGGMLPKPMGGKVVKKRKVLADGRVAVQYMDGTEGFE